jgi:peptidoglycan/LPS O-acetylase OafA/YrhL
LLGSAKAGIETETGFASGLWVARRRGVKILLLRAAIAFVVGGAVYAVYLWASGSEVQYLIVVNIVAIPTLLLVLRLVSAGR